MTTYEYEPQRIATLKSSGAASSYAEEAGSIGFAADGAIRIPTSPFLVFAWVRKPLISSGSRIPPRTLAAPSGAPWVYTSCPGGAGPWPLPEALAGPSGSGSAV
jgi:hypothetical protein